MEIMVNGKSMELPDGATAAGLLEQLKVHPERVAVEVNLTILKRDQLPSTVLKPGDQVEVVHFVGGGSRADSSCKTQDTRDTLESWVLSLES